MVCAGKRARAGRSSTRAAEKPLPGTSDTHSVSASVATNFPSFRSGRFRFTKLPASAANAASVRLEPRRHRSVGPASVALAGAVLLLPCVGATPAWSRDRILLVGNSFSQGVKNRLRSLTRSALRDASVSVSARDGWTLGVHSTARSTLRRIGSTEWHTVVLQEQSDGIDEERYPDARTIDAEVEAAGSRTVFFMTWADRDDELSEYERLRGVAGGTEGYLPIAIELDSPVAPVGWVFREVLLEEPDAELWSLDGHHASERGRYLAALTLYATIFAESPVGLWPHPALPLDQVLHDQLLVERVVLGDQSEWNIDVP
jgi:hypothetical protein